MPAQNSTGLRFPLLSTRCPSRAPQVPTRFDVTGFLAGVDATNRFEKLLVQGRLQVRLRAGPERAPYVDVACAGQSDRHRGNRVGNVAAYSVADTSRSVPECSPCIERASTWQVEKRDALTHSSPTRPRSAHSRRPPPSPSASPRSTRHRWCRATHHGVPARAGTRRTRSLAFLHQHDTVVTTEESRTGNRPWPADIADPCGVFEQSRWRDGRYAWDTSDARDNDVVKYKVRTLCRTVNLVSPDPSKPPAIRAISSEGA